MKNIYIIGHTGCGKTSIASELAKELNMFFKDTDAMVEKMFDKPVKDIFAQDGEEQFRIFETAALLQTTLTENHVVSTGAGICNRASNGDYMKKYGTLIYLCSTVNEQVNNLTPDEIAKRPILANSKDVRKTLEDLYEHRDFIYRYYADFIVETENRSKEEILADIISIAKRNRLGNVLY